MATRPRTPTFRTQPSFRRVYETLQPSSEMKETPEAFLLLVYLPGFTRDSIKITFVGSSRVVRITGERPIQGNRWSRFDKTYPVPENCQAEALQGKFDMGTLGLTMPKKSISQVASKPEVNKTPERRSSGPLDKVAVTEENTQKPQETIPPQRKTTTKLEEQNGDKKRASLPSPMKGPSELNAKKATESQKPEDVKGSKTLNPPEPVRDRSPQTVKRPPVTGKPQKGQEEFEAKQNSAMTTTIQKDDEKPLKREEEVEQKLTLGAAARDQAEEKREDEIKLKARLAAMKKQLQEMTEVSEKERTSREVKEQGGEYSESRKPVMNNTLEKGIFKEKEIRTRKVSPKEAEPSAPKVHQEKDNESSSASENMVDILGNGIRELASSASHVVTRITEGKLNDEEKYLMANMGAAVLVIAALGAYVSCKFAGA